MGLVVRRWNLVLLLSLVLVLEFENVDGLARHRRQMAGWRDYQRRLPAHGSSRLGGAVYGFGASRGGTQRGSAGAYAAERFRQFPQIEISPINVLCEENTILVSVRRDFYRNGRSVNPSDLSLGTQRCKPTDPSVDPIIFHVSLQECGNIVQMTADWMIYSTKLIYKPTSPGNVPISRTSPAVIPINCYYTRYGNVSSKDVKPTWIPFSTTVSNEERLNFSLRLMADDWSIPRDSMVYQLGDIIYVEAQVDILNHVGMILFVDSCVATISPDPDSSPRYEIIKANGCLVDGQQEDTSSAFVSPRINPNRLRFTFDAFRFQNTDTSSIYITCQLRAAADTQVPDSMNKACSYSKITKSWFAVEGPSNICQCCETGSCSAPSGRTGYWGSFGQQRQHWKRDVGLHLEETSQVVIGPLLVIEAPAQQAPRTERSYTSSESTPVVLWMLVVVALVSLVLVAAVTTLIGKCIISRMSC
ncbi:zona pellucida sperm-binding protein 3-like [Pyxicephalus adspersus]|uniref:zona pellucida sperm-binding protein 3-like n=1 Tax=Pyxicephalus adspersus TaxID=30357 RepID=UPI003B5B0EF2